MDYRNHKVLITGGSSGIGLELSKQLLEKGNRVIICGRDQEKLRAACQAHPTLESYPCDLADPEQCLQLCDWIKKEHPDTNVLINNAAIVHTIRFLDDTDSVEKCQSEIDTNLLAPIRLTKALIPVLMQNERPAVINITTGLIYAPRADYPFYNATKAALHAFTQVLRMQLRATNLNVIEVMFPVVDTPWHNGKPPKIAISPQKAVQKMLLGLEKDRPEIRIAGVRFLYLLSRLSPQLAIRIINNLQK
ncbi:SDR family oxidoreductase [Larkinella sp. VNQ87]|uniref:SDR family oxidoreductase n=1 Tax=Larkinella sp. VNQ87 TaxID=3400921 RepID=UPI003C00919D